LSGAPGVLDLRRFERGIELYGESAHVFQRFKVVVDFRLFVGLLEHRFGIVKLALNGISRRLVCKGACSKRSKPNATPTATAPATKEAGSERMNIKKCTTLASMVAANSTGSGT
jgi:hypothetical protein